MRLAHALSHSPNPDPNSNPLGFNLCEPFRRHSLTVILNFCIDPAGLTDNTDHSSFAS